MAEIDLNNCPLTVYKYPLRNRQWIPLLVFDIGASRVEDINIINRDFVPKTNINLPYWVYYPNKNYAQPIAYLRNYQDDFLKVSYSFDSSSSIGTFIFECHDGNTVLGSFEYLSSSTNTAETICPFMPIFFRFTDGTYINQNNNVIKYFAFHKIIDINYSNSSIPVEDKLKGYFNLSKVHLYSLNGTWSNQTDANTDKIIKGFLKKAKVYVAPDPDDPFDSIGNSTPGGGGGDGDIGGDTNDDDGLPTISALDSGLLTAYNPTEAELQSLGRFLWSDSFDVNTFKKIINDPFDTLLGLSVIPIAPKTSGNKNIMFGNLDSGISSPVVSSQWVSKDMGTLQLNEVWKGALDYSPSTAVSVYLPFIGMRQLNVNDVMGSSLHLIYKFDVLTGTCIAQIYVNHNAQGNKDSGGFSYTKNQGLIYEFMGQCSVNIPLASQDFTNTIRAAISAVGMVSGAAASIATGNPALGIASLAVSAANSGMQANTPTVERSGHLSGSGALLGYYQPFLVVERPHQCKPQRYYALRGIPSQVYTAKLAECTGFTQITDNNNIHASGAQDTELEELERLLSSGVYFPDKKRS